MEDKWKDIEGYKGIYQVSDKGKVRSKLIPTQQGTKIADDWHIMQESIGSNGIPRVVLIKHKSESDNTNPRIPHKREYRYVAQLVLEAFVSPKPTPNHQAIRKDSDKKNVELSNLKWGERSEVNNFLKHNGLMVVGSDLPQHKLIELEVKEIKDELINGFLTISEIAECYGVGYNCIADIKRNKNWKHVKWPKGTFNEYTFRECIFCGDQFKTDRFGVHKKYCSDQCLKNKAKLDAKRRKSTQEYKNKEKLRESGHTYKEHFGTYRGTCECCGEDYEVDLSVRLEGKQPDYFSKKYCSKGCCKKQSYLKSVGKTYNEVYGTIKKQCEACGQVFELGPDDYKGQKYCRTAECDRERERKRSAMRRWKGKNYWNRKDKLERNYT